MNDIKQKTIEKREKYKKIETQSERALSVVKSNDLIQNTRYKLGLQEQKIILYCISKIKPTDTGFSKYEFDLKHLCDICGIDYNGKNYQNFKNNIKKLSDNSFWLSLNGDEILCRWVVKAKITRNETKVEITLDETLMPYLLQLKNNFTQYELQNVLLMKSKYSVRLYEILKSQAYKNKVRIPLVSLKQLLNTAEYKVYQNFKVRVIQPAINEINTLTDLNIEVIPIKENKTIIALDFIIEEKTLVEKYEIHNNRLKEFAERENK